MGPKCKTDYFLMRVLKGCYMVVTHNDVETPLNFNISKTVFGTSLGIGGMLEPIFLKINWTTSQKVYNTITDH